ncbi:MAG TPA: hypothetical protein IAB74_02985 [Candidatus Faecousia excrementigallinarum]|uniref:Uncharacterized protein n=1 Tax=Candidatus Faecousia excrementigallinarum TaxID=2840806 RepID=A0A9D1CLX0_9FIRM|nr:hypothetical protein [Candidatus Faecousia excrementigallinarum]
MSVEQETFLSGYCRCTDGSRMVAVVTEDHILVETDCNYPDCPYTTECCIAAGIRELCKES